MRPLATGRRAGYLRGSFPRHAALWRLRQPETVCEPATRTPVERQPPANLAARWPRRHPPLGQLHPPLERPRQPRVNRNPRPPRRRLLGGQLSVARATPDVLPSQSLSYTRSLATSAAPSQIWLTDPPKDRVRTRPPPTSACSREHVHRVPLPRPVLRAT